MEASSLALAHDHARAAVVATQGLDTTIAINEHALAAGEFAKAASGTGSAEALRTLRLLEQHHQRLSELLRYPTDHPVTPNANEPEVKAVTEKSVSTSAAVAELRASHSDLGPRTSPLDNAPSLQTPRRLPPRDLSSSIASNLASARGIRSSHSRQPLSPSVSSLQAPGNIEGRREVSKRSKVPTIPEHTATSKPSWVPPQPTQKKADPQTSTSRTSAVAEPKSPRAIAHDEGFSKFYSAFNSVVYKLSAPLAFAGLPLFSETDLTSMIQEVPSTTSRKSKPPSRERMPTEEPDLTKYISKAALRASARDGHSGNDSFYVVPTTGHTVSYAHILSFAEKEKRRLAASMHSADPDLFPDPNDEEDFVDARETPMPNSPSNLKRNRRIAGRETDIRIEELDLENTSLKQCIDKLSSRLHAFEMAAQNSSLALQESIRLMRPEDRSLGGGSNDESIKRRLIELEEQMSMRDKENERLFRENEKLRETVAKYRNRWDVLKAGAKSRRDNKDSSLKGGESREGSLKEDNGSIKDGNGGNSKDTRETGSVRGGREREVGGMRFLAG
ncbi:hypothetical protein SBOR_5122 [Sclerotinia borealis F-4128]|uniref:Uncharacterized protein n=1 Tax=Sclerotinia borealis (strain F-4128) TaxID=1432307 RepID=W9CIG6_SCLBF|nr:hypothetical protein SBOR_5122 [Sclerotinia borealis F-4128]